MLKRRKSTRLTPGIMGTDITPNITAMAIVIVTPMGFSSASFDKQWPT